METTKGKLRNMTTGILHTNIGDVYEFLEKYLGAEGIMTHQIPSACRALEPFLKAKLSEEWFTKVWEKDGLDEPAQITDLTQEEKKIFWESYGEFASALWDKIKDKTIAIKI